MNDKDVIEVNLKSWEGAQFLLGVGILGWLLYLAFKPLPGAGDDFRRRPSGTIGVRG